MKLERHLASLLKKKKPMVILEHSMQKEILLGKNCKKKLKNF